MNIVPVITLFGGLAVFFTAALALTFAASKAQMNGQKEDSKVARS